MASITEFSANLRKSNVSRPYLFYVNIVPPARLQNQNSQMVSMYCQGAQTPILNFQTADDYFEDGIQRHAVYDYNYQSLTLDFLVDMDYKIKNFFDEWAAIVAPSRRIFAYPDEYTSDVLELNIISLEGEGKEDNKKTYQYTFNRVFPKTLTQVNLDSRSAGSATFAVTFEFETYSYKKL